MTNNELLRGIRNVLQLDDATMIRVFREAGREFGLSTISAFMKTEDEDDYIPCSNPVLGFFLDGLIIHYRGRKEGTTEAVRPVAELDNNVVLKKLRIALDLKEEEMIDTLMAGGIAITKQELTGLFRKKGHKHFKECSDQVLGGFIRGVALRRKG